MRCSHRAGGVVTPAGATRRLWAANCRPCRADTAQKRRNGAGSRPPIRGATRPRWAHSAHTLSGCARLGPFGALFARFASALAPGPLPLRASASGRRARPPLRGPGPALAPSLRSPGPALGPSPPAPPLGPCAPLRGSVGARWPRCAWVALAALRPPCLVGLASSRASPCASRVPRRGPPLARPLRGFGAGGLRPGGPARPFGPLVLASGPPGLLCSRGLPRCAITSGGGLSRSSERPALRADLDRSRLRRCGFNRNP